MDVNNGIQQKTLRAWSVATHSDAVVRSDAGSKNGRKSGSTPFIIITPAPSVFGSREREREREKRALCFFFILWRLNLAGRRGSFFFFFFFCLNRPPCRHLTIFSAASYQSAHLCVRGRTNNTRSPSLSNYFHPPGPVFPTYDRRRTLRRGFNTLSVGYRFCEYASIVLQGTQIHHSKCPAMWNIGPLSTHTREKNIPHIVERERESERG